MKRLMLVGLLLSGCATARLKEAKLDAAVMKYMVLEKKVEVLERNQDFIWESIHAGWSKSNDFVSTATACLSDLDYRMKKVEAKKR